jgi:hypothetical protein
VQDGGWCSIFVAALNDALDLRRLSPELRAYDWLKRVAELIPV